MTKIISIPTDKRESSGANEEFRFGYHEIQHDRSRQEDALAWQILSVEELTPQGETQLTPQEIAHRLWTCHRLLDEQNDNDLGSGSTASTTVYDGQGNLITATLADTSAFLVFYDHDGNPLGTRRLNSIMHRPDDEKEQERIKKAGGCIFQTKSNTYRVVRSGFNPEFLSLGLSRAIGDKFYKKAGICANSKLDIVNIAEAAKELGIDPDGIGTTQVISVCDGFTDAAGPEQQTKKGHEKILFEFLEQIGSAGTQTEGELAKLLVEKAAPYSQDNISVAVQNIDKDTPAFLLGLYDGHGGQTTSTFAAENIAELFTQLCTLTREAYAAQKLSVNNNEELYRADNPDSIEIEEELYRADNPDSIEIEAVLKLSILTTKYKENLDSESPEGKTIVPILDQLLIILKNSNTTDQIKIQAFYDYMNCTHTTEGLKNIEVIEKDKNISALKFIFGVVFIFVSLVTLILPSLLISGGVYLATGRSPFDLFNSEGEQYIKEVTLVETRDLKGYGAFFKSAPLTEKELSSPLPTPDDDSLLLGSS